MKNISAIAETLKHYPGKPIRSKESILKGATRLTGPCIYFLILRDEIVYIGKSICLTRRLGQHLQDKEFDAISYIECPKNMLTMLEYYYIREFKPKLNEVHNLEKTRQDVADQPGA